MDPRVLLAIYRINGRYCHYTQFMSKWQSITFYPVIKRHNIPHLICLYTICSMGLSEHLCILYPQSQGIIIMFTCQNYHLEGIMWVNQ